MQQAVAQLPWEYIMIFSVGRLTARSAKPTSYNVVGLLRVSQPTISLEVNQIFGSSAVGLYSPLAIARVRSLISF